MGQVLGGQYVEAVLFREMVWQTQKACGMPGSTRAEQFLTRWFSCPDAIARKKVCERFGVAYPPSLSFPASFVPFPEQR